MRQSNPHFLIDCRIVTIHNPIPAPRLLTNPFPAQRERQAHPASDQRDPLYAQRLRPGQHLYVPGQQQEAELRRHPDTEKLRGRQQVRPGSWGPVEIVSMDLLELCTL